MSQPLPRTLRERIVHALAFEAIAVLICAPTLAWLMGKPLLHLGVLTLM
ncbi:chlorhexidine efflux transporter, partial [Bowmanella yangjiangensis]